MLDEIKSFISFFSISIKQLNAKQSGRKASSSIKTNIWTEDDTSEEDIKPDIEDFSCKSRSCLKPLFKWLI